MVKNETFLKHQIIQLKPVDFFAVLKSVFKINMSLKSVRLALTDPRHNKSVKLPHGFTLNLGSIAYLKFKKKTSI